MRQHTQIAVFSALALAALTFENAPGEYEVDLVTDGGTVQGIVRLREEPETPAKLKVTKDHKTCGETIEDETLLVKDGLIQNVVVSIEGIIAGKEPSGEQAALSNLECRFVPHVQTMQAKAKLTISNADPVLHNTHGFHEDGTTAFNLALPLQGQKIKKRIKGPGVISMKCDAGHTWMSAYVVAFEHPYHAVTDERGAFTITDVPPGTYTLELWHEKLPSREVRVEVKPGEATSMELEMGEKE